MKPKPTNQRTLTLVQVTDTHLFADPATMAWGWNPQASLEAVLAHIRENGQRPAAVLATGDLVHDESVAGYERLAAMLGAFGAPVLALPGNHDDPATMRLHMTGALVGDRHRLDGWQVLLLDSHQPGKDAGRIDGEALAQVEAWLGDERPALIAVHHPPVPVGSAWLDAIGLDGGKALLEIAARHEQVHSIVCGHVHQAFESQVDSLRVMTTPSTCRQFRPHSDEFADDDQPPGYRLLHLHRDGGLNSEVIRVPAARLAGLSPHNT